jgi:hypothetical protein
VSIASSSEEQPLGFHYTVMGDKTKTLLVRVVEFPESSGFTGMSTAKALVGRHWFIGNNTQSTGVSPANQPSLLTKSVTAPFAK